MTCPGCKAENPDGKKFCGEYGAVLEKLAPVAVVGGDGAWYCAKHPKAVTRLRCGRYEAPICPRCANNSRSKNTPLRASRVAAYLAVCAAALALTISCSRRPLATAVSTPTPHSATGWGPGQVIAHGYMQTAHQLTKAWPPGSSEIHVADSGTFSPWRECIKSSGYWEIRFRWQGLTPPASQDYMVVVSTYEIANCTGNATASARLVPLPPTWQPSPSAWSNWQRSGIQSANMKARVKRDASGYFLSITTPPVYGQVAQREYFHSWGGDLTAKVEFSAPTSASALTVKTKHSKARTSL